MKTLSLGAYRGLQQCAGRSGAFAVLAIDHRNNLRKLLSAGPGGSASDDTLTAFKREVVSALAPHATAVLLDPEFGAAQCLAAGALPGDVGLVVALEATGYAGEPDARHSRILPGWSAAKARRMGASAVKLLAYYHPEAATAAQIETLVDQVASDCARADLAFFLEPLSYSLDPARKGLGADERRQVVIETARRLTPRGAHVLKAEFPLDTAAQPDERQWAAACAELTATSSVPWILLSASADFDTYLRQVTVACRAGASGVAAGRAIWREAAELSGEARAVFLRDTAVERMQRLTALCQALGRPWYSVCPPPQVTTDWYQRYGNDG